MATYFYSTPTDTATDPYIRMLTLGIYSRIIEGFQTIATCDKIYVANCTDSIQIAHRRLDGFSHDQMIRTSSTNTSADTVQIKKPPIIEESLEQRLLNVCLNEVT